MTKFLTIAAVALGTVAGSGVAYAGPDSPFKGVPEWMQQAFTPQN